MEQINNLVAAFDVWCGDYGHKGLDEELGSREPDLVGDSHTLEKPGKKLEEYKRIVYYFEYCAKMLELYSSSLTKTPVTRICQINYVLLKLIDKIQKTDWNYTKNEDSNLCNLSKQFCVDISELQERYIHLLPQEEQKEWCSNYGITRASLKRRHHSYSKNIVKTSSYEDSKCLSEKRKNINKILSKCLPMSIEKRDQNELSKIYQQLWTNVFHNLRGQTKNFKKQMTLHFNCSKNYSEGVLKKIKFLSLPMIEKVKVKSVSKRNNGDQFLMNDSFQNRYSGLYFSTKDLINTNYCLRNIARILPTIKEKVHLDKFKLSLSHLKHILKSCAHVSYLVLGNCIVSVPEIPDLSICLKGTVISSLSLVSCSFMPSCCEPSTVVKNLLDGILSTEMKKTLKEIRLVRNKDLVKSEIKQILNKCGMKKISIKMRNEN
ncbi:unnamed protein product [Moneuplotes crassus]|uniref:Uncharacterized protein n=1 Tax=Euplotes crassus TaxID=5936 RepID=A0AAD1UHS8_EUPCR|nr:unnamed protein product [Moneuplotes crassus]